MNEVNDLSDCVTATHICTVPCRDVPYSGDRPNVSENTLLGTQRKSHALNIGAVSGNPNLLRKSFLKIWSFGFYVVNGALILADDTRLTVRGSY